MNQQAIYLKFEKGLRGLSVIALFLLLFQSLGVLLYLVNVWPGTRSMVGTGTAVLGAIALSAALLRSALWIKIYWSGAKAISSLRALDDSADVSQTLVPRLRVITRLLIASCALEVLLLPAIFLMDTFFPFTISSVQLGMIQAGAMMLPQAFGVAALMLAYLTHQLGRLMSERSQMKRELELTI